MTRKPSARTRRTVDATLVDAGKCGRPTKGAEAKGPYCTRPAGWGTDHPRAGACKLHGGCSAIKHGYDSEIIRERLGDSFNRFKNDPNIATVDGEVALLRGLVEKAIEAGREGEDVAMLAEKVVRAVETMARIRQKFGITIETMTRLMEQMGIIVERHVKDLAVISAISRDWEQINIA